MTAMLVLLLCEMSAQDDRTVVSSPNAWPDNDRYLALEMRTSGGIPPGDEASFRESHDRRRDESVRGSRGTGTLKRGGSAADAALTTALAQIALNAGAAIELRRNLDSCILRREFGQGVLTQCGLEHASQ